MITEAEQYGKHAVWRVNGVWYPVGRIPVYEIVTQSLVRQSHKAQHRKRPWRR